MSVKRPLVCSWMFFLYQSMSLYSALINKSSRLNKQELFLEYYPNCMLAYWDTKHIDINYILYVHIHKPGFFKGEWGGGGGVCSINSQCDIVLQSWVKIQTFNSHSSTKIQILIHVVTIPHICCVHYNVQEKKLERDKRILS